MIRSSACQPWQPDLPGHAGDAVALVSYITQGDTTVPKRGRPLPLLLDVAVIHLRRTPLFRTVIPSKLFGCMAMGIQFYQGWGESAEIVERESVGLTFQPESASELVEKVLRMAGDAELRQQFARRGPEVARAYDRASLASQMLRLLTDVVEQR